MFNPADLPVLGVTRNEPDAQMLKASLESFPANVINAESLENKSSDFIGDIRRIVTDLNPKIIVLFIADVSSAASLASLLKGIVAEKGGSKPYWVAITRDTCQSELTKQIGELDVESILFAPFTVEQITLNLTTGYQGHAEQERLEAQYQQASETARTAMEAASEIGYVMQLVDNLGHAATYDDVGNKLFKIFSSMGIKSYLQIFDGHDTYLFSENEVNESVQHILTNAMSSKVRIIEHKRLLLLKLDYVILMVINAPWENAAKYGRIKDMVCQMGPVVEARVRTIMVNNLIEEQHEKVMSIMNMMRMLSSDSQNNTRAIMQDLSQKLEVAAMSLDLNEEQEEHLLGLSNGALDSLELMYSANDALEGHFLTLMQSLTKVRELTNEQLHSNDGGDDDDADAVELF